MPEVLLEARDIPALALGCDLLGSGGGGPTEIARPVLTDHLASREPVRILTDPKPGMNLACVGAYGAATVMLESLPDPGTFVRALRGLEQAFGPVEGLIPLETGGVNGLLAVLVASATGLPLVDADPMGRAFSAIADTVLAATVPVRSVSLASPAGHSLWLEADDVTEIERVLRSLLPAVGGWAAVATCRGSAGDLLPHTVSGPLTRAVEVGRALLAAGAGDTEALQRLEGTQVVVEGWVTEVNRDPGVEVRGVASISQQATLTRGRHPVRVDIANEYLTVISAGELLVSAPDLIAVLDTSWRPIPAEELRVGQQVRVLAVEAPADLVAAHQREVEAGRVGFGLASRGYQPVGV